MELGCDFGSFSHGFVMLMGCLMGLMDINATSIHQDWFCRFTGGSKLEVLTNHFLVIRKRIQWIFTCLYLNKIIVRDQKTWIWHWQKWSTIGSLDLGCSKSVVSTIIFQRIAESVGNIICKDHRVIIAARATYHPPWTKTLPSMTWIKIGSRTSHGTC